MATYVIGDLQGCYSCFVRLLDQISFRPTNDHLILLGDLINRGPDSLLTLQKIYELRDCVSIVLGNHDLNTMAVLAGHRDEKPEDTINKLLNHTQGVELVHWLRSQPLLIVEDNYVFCHAGVYPKWNLEEAQLRAREVEFVLQSSKYKYLLENMYGPNPVLWKDSLDSWKRYRFILNAFTRMRFVSEIGALDHAYSVHPKNAPNHLIPWFQYPQRIHYSQTTMIGHWSTLGLYKNNNVVCLDTGCVWGGQLTAAELHTNPLVFHSTRC